MAYRRLDAETCARRAVTLRDRRRGLRHELFRLRALLWARRLVPRSTSACPYAFAPFLVIPLVAYGVVAGGRVERLREARIERTRSDTEALTVAAQRYVASPGPRVPRPG
ncbi:MAG: hypothetical protein AB8I08_11010 [Sandaracinaceae bacterium]